MNSLPLSPREREILDLAALGLTNNEIAEELGIAFGTVSTHLGRAYLKLGVRNRAAAVAAVMQEGAA